jgi:hypothetical protein
LVLEVIILTIPVVLVGMEVSLYFLCQEFKLVLMAAKMLCMEEPEAAPAELIPAEALAGALTLGVVVR